MNIIRMAETPIGTTPHNVDVRKLFESEHVQIVHILLKPGESLKKHITPVDVAFYVLEGKGTVQIGEESMDVGPDSVVESPKGIVHTWHNGGDGPFRVLVIKTPRPTNPTRML